MQFYIRVPLARAGAIDFIHFDTDAHIVGLEEFDGGNAVAERRLLHQRVVVGLSGQFFWKRLSLFGQFQFSTAGRDNQKDLSPARDCRLLAFPILKHSFWKRSLVQRLRPRYALNMMSEDIAILAHEASRRGDGLRRDVMHEAGESHAECAGAVRCICGLNGTCEQRERTQRPRDTESTIVEAHRVSPPQFSFRRRASLAPEFSASLRGAVPASRGRLQHWPPDSQECALGRASFLPGPNLESWRVPLFRRDRKSVV